MNLVKVILLLTWNLIIYGKEHVNQKKRIVNANIKYLTGLNINAQLAARLKSVFKLD